MHLHKSNERNQKSYKLSMQMSLKKYQAHLYPLTENDYLLVTYYVLGHPSELCSCHFQEKKLPLSSDYQIARGSFNLRF